MEKKLVLLGLTMVCLLGSQVFAALADDYYPHLEVTSTSTPFSAGRNGTVTITITNNGNFEATEIEAFLNSVNPGFFVLTEAQKVINILTSEKSATYSATVYVDQSVGVGAYELNLQLNYVRMGKAVMVNIPITVMVNQIFQPKIELNLTSNRLAAGQINNLTLAVKNISTENLTNVEIAFNLASQSIWIEGNPSIAIPTLTAGASASFPLKIATFDQTPIGVYTLSATLYYYSSGYSYKQSDSVSMEVASPALTISPIVIITSLYNPQIFPGQNFTLTLQVDCKEAPIYNAKGTLALDQGGLLAPLGPTISSLGNMKPGEHQTLTYKLQLDGSASVGQMSINQAVTYIDTNGQPETVSQPITVNIDQYTVFSLQNTPTLTVQRGATLTVNSNLLLIGTTAIQFARIDAVPSSQFQTITTSSEYLGSTEPDSPVPFSISVKTNAAVTPGNYTLQLKISYFNHSNFQVSKIISVPVTVTTATTTRTPGTTQDSGIVGWLRALLGIR